MPTYDTGRRNNPLFASPNRLKLGIFCTNTYSALTTVPEMPEPTWENALKVARLADAIGLEAIVPIARWKGYLDGQPGHRTHEVFDTFTYAAGIAQATSYSSIFATTHAPTVNPVFVAKQSATIDAISNGRFCLNVVGGWNRREFDMFGIDLLSHGERYAYLAEWLTLLKRLWTSPDEIDYHSRYFRLKGAVSRPQPRQKPTIPIMNAGLSPSGMRFAAEHSEIGLITLFGPDPAAWRQQVAEYKAMAKRDFGRELQVWTNVSITVRDTTDEAEAYLKRYSEEYLDEESLESFLATLSLENGIAPGSERYMFMRRSLAIGLGAPAVGSPRDVADQLSRFTEVGLDGVILTFVDFVDGLTRLQRDVFPLLEQAGLRQPFERPS